MGSPTTAWARRPEESGESWSTLSELTPVGNDSQHCGDTVGQALLCRGQEPTWPKAECLRAQAGTNQKVATLDLGRL